MSGEKKFPASAKKLKKAREDGDVARSRDLTFVVVLFSQLLCLCFLSSQVCDYLTFFREALVKGVIADPESIKQVSYEAAIVLVSLVSPFLVSGLVAGIFGEFIQVGFHISAASLALKFSRLNPVSGLQRILGIDDNKFTMILPFKLGKLWIFVGFSVILFWTHLPVLGQDYIDIEENPALTILHQVANECSSALFLAAAFYLVIGLFDFLHERRRRATRLMMDAEELKQEFKDSEGDPYTKQARNQLHWELANYSSVNDVRSAKVVITDSRSA